MTQIEHGGHAAAQTTAAPAPAPPQPPTGTTNRDRLFYGVIAVILLAAVGILGYTALRPSTTPAAPVPSASVDTRGADEAAALDTLQKVHAALAVADRNRTVDGSGLETLVSPSVLERNRTWYQNLREDGVTIRGETVHNYKVRAYTVNPGETRVTIAHCNDLRGSRYVANRVEQPIQGPDGKPADWTFSSSELTKQLNGSWLLTSGRVITGGTGTSCSLDAPL